MRHHLQMPKVARNAFNIGEVWIPVCCHGNNVICSSVGIITYCKFVVNTVESLRLIKQSDQQKDI